MSTSFAARHTCDSPEWYTPASFVEAARRVMGRIDLDPASHAEANLTVKADVFYTEADNGLTQPWFGSIFINPPGGLVAEFWKKLMTQWRAHNISEAIWVGYSLEQLQTLQNADAASPIEFPICIPRRRIAFVENEAKRFARLEKIDAENEVRLAKGEKLKRRSEKADGPSHGNYIIYLGPDVQVFRDVFSEFGTTR